MELDTLWMRVQIHDETHWPCMIRSTRLDNWLRWRYAL